MMPPMIFRSRPRLIALLALILLSVQSLSPVLPFAQNSLLQSPLLVDANYCGTRIENPGPDVVMIRAPIANETALPATHTDEHCPLCYIHTPSFIIGYTNALSSGPSNFLSVAYFSSIPNHSLQDQQLQLLAPTHAPPYFA